MNELALTLREAKNKDVTYVRVEEGGHHEAMIKDGIPRGIQWIRDRMSVR